jgi:hypothetical protein
MSKVSEKAIFSNYKPIPLQSKVNIIPKDFTEFNTKNFGIFSTDDTKFLNGTLVSKEEVSSAGYGGILQYVVKLDNSDEEITFSSSPPTYYFKVNTQTSFGGKKSRRKRNINKSRKNRRKSSRRYSFIF